VTPITDPGVTWKINSTALTGLSLITYTLDQPEGDIKYYQVATDDRGGKYVLCSAVVGMGVDSYFLLKQDAAGAWSLLTRYSDLDLIDTQDATLVLDKSVTRSDASLASLDLPTRLTIKGGSLLQVSMHGGPGDQMNPSDYQTETLLAKTEYGTLYIRESKKAEGDTTVGKTQTLVLARNDGRYSVYQLAPSFLRDDKTLSVTPTSGLTLPGKYNLEGLGCGGTANAYVLDSELVSDKVQVATSADGVIFTLNSATNSVVAEYFQDYSGSRTGTDESVVTSAEFMAAHPILIWQDQFGRLIELKNAAFAPLAECGKPVVYLYPTTKTAVSVKVDADVTVSDPAYGSGWQAVAEPSGRLTVAGATYPYLFWEGFGHGSYPDVTSIGTVVTRADLIPTLKSQMTQLGLTATEQADFLEFWADRLPTTPYTRLTWLTTREMEQVAKLTIEPKPDTLIRVFLDFAGLSVPQTLRTQRLSAPARQGFVAVEWGGSLSSK